MAEEVLWAPWRGQYVAGPKGADGCFLCQCHLDPPERDAANYVVYRGVTCYIIMDLFPYNNGHLMVAPYAHLGDPADLSAEVQLEMMQLATLSVRALRHISGPHGFNLGMNIGAAAGAGVADHLHLHVVPRWRGDVNFMPVVGGTRVIPEALDETWAKLREAITELAGTTTKQGEE